MHAYFFKFFIPSEIRKLKSETKTQKVLRNFLIRLVFYLS